MRVAGETLPFNSTLTKVQHSFKKVPWTYSPEGTLRSGDTVMLRSKINEGHLAVDLGAKQDGVEGAFRLSTTTTAAGPATRNVFVVSRVEK